MNPELPDGELRAVFGRASSATGETGATGAIGATAEQLYEPVASASAGIWRVRHASRTAVLKLVRHSEGGHPQWQSSNDPGSWYYWRREVLAYETGLLSSLPGGLRAPACRLAAERADGSVALWLEDLTGTPATTWAVARYCVAARHLAQMQGAFLVQRVLPDARWLSRGWLRAYVGQRDGDMSLLDTATAELPASLMRGVAAMRADQDRFLGALAQLPPTLCHLDLHPANLFADSDASTAAIDWSFVGIGTIGEDAGNLVADAVLDFHVAAADLDALYEAVASGYTCGLRDAGWNGDDWGIRLAMSATMAAKYAWIAPAIARAIGEDRELLNRRPIDDALQWWLPMVPFLLDRADEARALDARLA